MSIKITRTGNVFSFTSVEFLVEFPDGSSQSIWSPPWQMGDDGAEVGYDDPRQDAGARREAERLWAEKSAA
jgi:hypothetical protein